MDIASAVLWVVGGLVLLLVLLFAFAFVVIVGLLILKSFKTKAKAAGVDFSDGIDAKEREIIFGMLTKHRATAAEQAVAVDLVNAAQASLQKSVKA